MEKILALVAVIVFAAIMAGVTYLIKRHKGKSFEDDLVESKPKENKGGAFEKYCNGNKNASRRQLANYILIHEDEERKKRGQK